jgi:hypothetical protein
LSARLRSPLDLVESHEFALTRIENFMLTLELDDVPSSRLVDISMTDRI